MVVAAAAAAAAAIVGFLVCRQQRPQPLATQLCSADKACRAQLTRTYSWQLLLQISAHNAMAPWS
jgi:hypothetical protein